MQIICLCELLVDFTPHGVSDTGMCLFEQNAGGASANVAVALARLGHTTAFVGKVGDDINGHFLRDILQAAGVDTSHLLADRSANTSMAFVARHPKVNGTSLLRVMPAPSCASAT